MFPFWRGEEADSEAWCSVGAWERCSEATAQEEQEKGEEEEEEEKEEEEGNSWNHLHKPKGVWPVYCTVQFAHFNHKLTKMLTSISL